MASGNNIQEEELEDVKLIITVEIHFPGFINQFLSKEKKAIKNLNCNRCLDMKMKVCPGNNLTGSDVLWCMNEHSSTTNLLNDDF